MKPFLKPVIDSDKDMFLTHTVQMKPFLKPVIDSDKDMFLTHTVQMKQTVRYQ